MNPQQQAQGTESYCSSMVAAAAGPVLALGAHIAANGSAERYITIVKDLYRANHLPCPDMQLLLQYCALPQPLTRLDKSSYVAPVDDMRDGHDGDYAIPDVVEDLNLEGEQPIGHDNVNNYEEPYSWVDTKLTGLPSLPISEMEDPYSWVDDKRTDFNTEVYSLVQSDMEDWFDEDVSLHCFPDTEVMHLSLDATSIPIATEASSVPPPLPPRTPLIPAKVKRTSTMLDKLGERRPCNIMGDEFNQVVDLSKISKPYNIGSSGNFSSSMESSNVLKVSQGSRFYTPAASNFGSSGLGSMVSSSFEKQNVSIYPSSLQCISQHYPRRSSYLDSRYSRIRECNFPPVQEMVSPRFIVNLRTSSTNNERSNKKGILKSMVGGSKIANTPRSTLHSTNTKKANKRKLFGQPKTSEFVSTEQDKSSKKKGIKKVMKSIKKKLSIKYRPLETDV